ncbi:MAG: bifunctional glutamate N-acetyltransferase/amino-acid acetyltransferase ArgJ [Actinomycetota bacterium]|nr:bifunctional glutamate N-acetyltransferase/amino-acid acetyltransferase ArgJ [Actinomycetota bacterium]
MNAKEIPGGICAPLGFTAAGTACGIKPGGLDISILAADERCSAAGTFTTNAFKAAPVRLTEEHLKKDGFLQAVVANSGNANAWTGEQGMEDARAMAVMAAEFIGAHPWDVAVASTGEIGVYLPMQRVSKGISDAASRLNREGGGDAALAIMTTDTRSKELAWDLGGFAMGGMAKGSGMIRPDMATMLAFITTDAEVEPAQLGQALRSAVDASFNLITIDGCTSTNDMVLVLASGASGVSLEGKEIEKHLFRACSHLSRLVVEDGEGATRFIVVRVHQAADGEEARRAALAVAESSLVKTAVFGGDPNWGRVIQALGASLEDADSMGVSVDIAGLRVAENGKPAEVDGKKLNKAMAGKEVELDINLGRGESEVEVWTCDLSYGYVKINTEYHT